MRALQQQQSGRCALQAFLSLPEDVLYVDWYARWLGIHCENCLIFFATLFSASTCSGGECARPHLAGPNVSVGRARARGRAAGAGRFAPDAGDKNQSNH